MMPGIYMIMAMLAHIVAQELEEPVTYIASVFIIFFHKVSVHD